MKEHVITLPAPWGAAVALGLINLIPHTHKPECLSPVLICQVFTSGLVYRQANQRILSHAEKCGCIDRLWDLGYASLSFRSGKVAAALVAGALGLYELYTSDPLRRYARFNLPGSHAWLLKDVQLWEAKEAA